MTTPAAKPTGDNYLIKIAEYAAMTAAQLSALPPGELTAWLAVVSLLGVSDTTMDVAFTNLYNELTLRASKPILTRANTVTPFTISNVSTQVTSFQLSPLFTPAGTIFQFEATGLLTNVAVDTVTTWQLRIGGVVVGEWTASIGDVARTDAPFRLCADLKCVTVGPSGTAWGLITLHVDDVVQVPAGPVTVVTAPVGVNLSIAQTIELVGVSNASSTLWKFVSATAVQVRV